MNLFNKYLLLVTFENDDNYSIQFEISNDSSTIWFIWFEMKNTICTAIIIEYWPLVDWSTRWSFLSVSVMLCHRIPEIRVCNKLGIHSRPVSAHIGSAHSSTARSTSGRSWGGASPSATWATHRHDVWVSEPLHVRRLLIRRHHAADTTVSSQHELSIISWHMQWVTRNRIKTL